MGDGVLSLWSLIKFTAMLKLSSKTLCTCVCRVWVASRFIQDVHVYLISLLVHQHTVKCIYDFTWFLLGKAEFLPMISSVSRKQIFWRMSLSIITGFCLLSVWFFRWVRAKVNANRAGHGAVSQPVKPGENNNSKSNRWREKRQQQEEGDSKWVECRKLIHAELR